MNRKHTVEQYLKIYEKLIKINPKIEFSSDFIISYPGETDKDFNETLNLVKKIKFINSYSFIFSPRPGTKAANHHHEGAEHFQVILKGSATFYVDDIPHSVRAGDTIYIYDNERHYFINDGEEELSFIEYFVPGVYKTVWAEGANICTWSPSGLNIKGGKPSREVKAHSSAEAHSIKEL